MKVLALLILLAGCSEKKRFAAGDCINPGQHNCTLKVLSKDSYT